MRDFSSKWGFSYKNIMNMSRIEFCNIHGDRFLNMTYCEFRRALKKETPHMDLMPVGSNGFSWKADRLVNKIEYKMSQLGVWDMGGQGEIL